MEVSFSKYHGAGNDFIFIDNRDARYTLNDDTRKRMCKRHFGIGSDGLLEIRSSDKADFRLIYFNSNGREGSLCGNGSRCAIAFALKIGIPYRTVRLNDTAEANSQNSFWTGKNGGQEESKMGENQQPEATKNKNNDELDDKSVPEMVERNLLRKEFLIFMFEAFDGIHTGGASKPITSDSSSHGNIGYVDIMDIQIDRVKVYTNGDVFVNSGSPHHVIFLSSSIEDLDVVKLGRDMRYALDGNEGSNVDFVFKGRNSWDCKENVNLKKNESCDSDQISSSLSYTAQSVDNGGDCLQQEFHTQKEKYVEDSKAIDENADNRFFLVRTYERGVNDETMACGTGCVAVAIADYVKNMTGNDTTRDADYGKCDNIKGDVSVSSNTSTGSKFKNQKDEFVQSTNMRINAMKSKAHIEKKIIKMPGGCLYVTFAVNDREESCGRGIRFSDIKLFGPVEHVFDGTCVI